MRITFFLLIFLVSGCSIQKQFAENVKEALSPDTKNDNHSSSYEEAIVQYQHLAEKYPQIVMKEYGMTDAGKPLHEVIISNSEAHTPLKSIQQEKVVVFINNAIHAGEPCGIDASLKLAEQLCTFKIDLLDHATVVIVPVYNIGGALNRGSFSRANQNGPDEYGFRGNAKNLDLNRDFIKCDSKNAQSMNQLFNKWDPDIFIDNHTSNGADYQYVITLIATQKDKLNSTLSNYMTTAMLPVLYEKMEDKGYEMTPYVNARNTPDDGIAGFLDLPRYSSGFAALHNAFSFMPETHMLKPYKDRVESTYLFMESVLEFVEGNYKNIREARNEAVNNTRIQNIYNLNWELDSETSSKIVFKGYEAKYKKSEISGQDRLYYDRSEPYEKEVDFYNDYKAALTVEAPISYIIPQAYTQVIERLEWNDVKMDRITEDKEMELGVYRILDYRTSSNPYESHYIHRNVEVEKNKEIIKVYKGDYIINVNQSANRYIVETLEPHAPDSFFAWNFFDGILMRKEYFSPYVFEDLAAELLKKDKDLKRRLEAKKATDEEFANSAYAQLNFIYENSPYYEPTYNRYPVYRVEY